MLAEVHSIHKVRSDVFTLTIHTSRSYPTSGHGALRADAGREIERKVWKRSRRWPLLEDGSAAADAGRANDALFSSLC